jgi:hypothetical protein
MQTSHRTQIIVSGLLFLVLSFVFTGCQVPAAPPDPSAPVASAGQNQTVSGGSTVTLNGTGSASSIDGTLTYSWQQVSGTPVVLSGMDTAQPTFTAPTTSGTLVFQLTITDSNGNTATATVTITILVSSEGPVANAGASQVVSGGDTVTLDGSGSSSSN